MSSIERFTPREITEFNEFLDFMVRIWDHREKYPVLFLKRKGKNEFLVECWDNAQSDFWRGNVKYIQDLFRIKMDNWGARLTLIDQVQEKIFTNSPTLIRDLKKKEIIFNERYEVIKVSKKHPWNKQFTQILETVTTSKHVHFVF